MTERKTFYVRFGDWFVWLATAIAVAVMLRLAGNEAALGLGNLMSSKLNQWTLLGGAAA